MFISWLTGLWDDRVMSGTDLRGAGEAADGPVRRRFHVATGRRWLLPRPTVRLLLSFLLFRHGLDQALQPPLPRRGLRPPPKLHGPFPTVAPLSGSASGIKQLGSKFPTRAQ